MSALGDLARIFSQLSTGMDESSMMRSALLEKAADRFNALAVAIEALDPNESTTVSNPPTQAEVQAINDRLKATRQALAT